MSVRQKPDFRELIRRKTYDMGLSLTQLRTQTGMSRDTFNRRMQRPADLTLGEIHILDLYLHFDDKEKLEILNMKYR